MIQPPIHKTPKTSPPLVDAVSCSSGGPSPVANHNSTLAQTPNSNTSNNSNIPNIPPTPPNSNSSNGILAITPKQEHSPPQNHYEPQRQTVLMWGASQTNPSTTRSPNSTPTSNGIYPDASGSHLKSSNQISPVSEDSSTGIHTKWNGIAKEHVPGVHVYPLHQHHDLNVDHSSMYSQALSHHSGGHLVSSEGLHHQGQAQNHNIGSNCEVWTPPSYSQYQYFTYHHAPQHASTQ